MNANTKTLLKIEIYENIIIQKRHINKDIDRKNMTKKRHKKN